MKDGPIRRDKRSSLVCVRQKETNIESSKQREAARE